MFLLLTLHSVMLLQFSLVFVVSESGVCVRVCVRFLEMISNLTWLDGQKLVVLYTAVYQSFHINISVFSDEGRKERRKAERKEGRKEGRPARRETFCIKWWGMMKKEWGHLMMKGNKVKACPLFWILGITAGVPQRWGAAALSELTDHAGLHGTQNSCLIFPKNLFVWRILSHTSTERQTDIWYLEVNLQVHGVVFRTALCKAT